MTINATPRMVAGAKVLRYYQPQLLLSDRHPILSSTVPGKHRHWIHPLGQRNLTIEEGIEIISDVCEPVLGERRSKL